MDSWNISFLLGGMTCFQGRSVGFRECNFSNFKLFRKITTEIEWLNTPIHLMFNWKLAFVSNKSGQWGVSDSNILNFPLTSPPKFQMFFCTRVFLVHRGSRKKLSTCWSKSHSSARSPLLLQLLPCSLRFRNATDWFHRDPEKTVFF